MEHPGAPSSGRPIHSLDDQGDLLNVEASRPDVRSDENTGSTLPELCHDGIPFLLWHFAVHRGLR